MAPGIADRVCTIGDLVDAALATQPIDPLATPRIAAFGFKVIEGGKQSWL